MLAFVDCLYSSLLEMRMGSRSGYTRVHLTFFLSQVSQPIIISGVIPENQQHASVTDSTAGKLGLWLWHDGRIDRVIGPLRVARDWRRTLGKIEVRHPERLTPKL